MKLTFLTLPDGFAEKGKYEMDYYTICGCKKAGSEKYTYWIKWLSSGGETCGFNDLITARKTADRIVQNCLNNPKLDASKL